YHSFFQAEDGIRDRNVTGVQTCALPICSTVAIGGCTVLVVRFSDQKGVNHANTYSTHRMGRWISRRHGTSRTLHVQTGDVSGFRSEERRVGKESKILVRASREQVKKRQV